MLSPVYRATATFIIDANQVELSGGSAAAAGPDPSHTLMERFEAALTSDLHVGEADGVVAIRVPVPYNPAAPLVVEVWRQEPPDDRDDWDQIVDVDLDCSAGGIALEAPTWDMVDVDLPGGRYRVRFAGRGYDTCDAEERGDSYRLQFWEQVGARPAALRKLWPGWNREPG